MAWQTGVVSDRGRVRTNNEDSVYINPEQGIFLIADGMGGHNAGEVASGLAVDAISTFLLNATPDALEKAVENANRIIYERSRHSPELYRMGTTIVAAVIAGTKLFLAHVGDSRAYLLQADRLQRLTEDHSLIYQMIKS
ncbi:MAG: serine/threonine-protein phosphatase, partial [Calditrichaeota bacterium]|nr:serine/threonine-protein phosphatase [Calditrichota bacterium]